MDQKTRDDLLNLFQSKLNEAMRFYLETCTRCGVCTEACHVYASMGQVNPVFERAGMRRIGEFPPSPAQLKALKELKILGVDPFDGRFAAEVCRRPRVRRIVCQFVRDWYRATTAGGEKRVAGQSPQLLAQTFSGLVGSRPVYYLWQQDKTP